eukprot:6690162-Prymnesium_polylepis.1
MRSSSAYLAWSSASRAVCSPTSACISDSRCGSAIASCPCSCLKQFSSMSLSRTSCALRAHASRQRAHPSHPPRHSSTCLLYTSPSPRDAHES